jgi:hypothetical protein
MLVYYCYQTNDLIFTVMYPKAKTHFARLPCIYFNSTNTFLSQKLAMSTRLITTHHFSGPEVSAASFIPDSQFRSSAILLLQISGNCKVRRYCGLPCISLIPGFVKIRQVVTKLKWKNICRRLRHLLSFTESVFIRWTLPVCCVSYWIE